VWSWFTELDATRQSFMAHGPITHTEIRNWAFNLQIELLPIEVRALMAVDRAFLLHSYSESRKKAEKGQ
jgi:hypothetical protein